MFLLISIVLVFVWVQLLILIVLNMLDLVIPTMLLGRLVVSLWHSPMLIPRPPRPCVPTLTIPVLVPWVCLTLLWARALTSMATPNLRVRLSRRPSRVLLNVVMTSSIRLVLRVWVLKTRQLAMTKLPCSIGTRMVVWIPLKLLRSLRNPWFLASMETVSVLFSLHLWVSVVGLGTLERRFPDGDVCPTLVTMGTLLVCPSYCAVLTGVGVVSVVPPMLLSDMASLWACRLLSVFVISLLKIDTASFPPAPGYVLSQAMFCFDR